MKEVTLQSTLQRMQRLKSLTSYTIFPALILLSSFAPVYSQTHLTLVLKTTEPIDSAFIVHWTDKESLWLPYNDTLQMDFKTTGIDFYHINYTAKGKTYNTQLFLDTGNVEVITKIVNGKLTVDTVIGSPMFYKTKKWNETYASLKEKKDSAAIDSFLLKSYEDNIDNVFSFIRSGATYLNIHQNNRLKLYALLPLIAKQSEEVKKRFGFSHLNERLQGIIKNDIVRLSDFNLIDINNKPVQPITRGRFAILDFWFVGCAPCMEDHSKMPKILPVLKEKKIEFISISNDVSYKKWKSYLSKHKYRWPQYKKSSGNQNIIEQLGITTYPTYILLNESGKILSSTYSLEEILRQLNIK